MGENSGIEWTDHTFNPWVGCTKVSPACDHCYAEGWAKRSGRVTWGAERKRTSESNWQQPLKWDRAAAAAGTRARVFCASLADVFDNEVPESWRADLFRLIRATPNLDWLLLTKRIGNAGAMIGRALVDARLHVTTRWPWPNVWVGATVVTQEEADRDIPKLLRVPARGRFLSIEPMLGPVDIARYMWPVHARWPSRFRSPEEAIEAGEGAAVSYHRQGLVAAAAVFLDWVIVGGESGPGARVMHPGWVRVVRDQCQLAGVPFLFKQWGEWAPPQPADDDVPQGACEGRMYRVGKKAAGRTLDGDTWDQLPNFEVGHEQSKQTTAGG